MAQPYKPPPRPDWGKVIDGLMTDLAMMQQPMRTTPKIKNYRDGDAILVDEPLPRRLYDKLPCVLCGRLKPQDEWCPKCGENEHTAAMLSMRDDRRSASAPNFIILDWSDQEIYESLIREDMWMGIECSLILVMLAMVGSVAWVWING